MKTPLPPGGRGWVRAPRRDGRLPGFAARSARHRPPVEAVAARGDALRQRLLGPAGEGHGLVAGEHGAGGGQAGQQGGERGGERQRGGLVAGADVGVDEGGGGGQADMGQGVEEVADDEAVFGRRAVGMGGRGALEHEDVAVRQAGAEMVVAAPVAEAELQHRAGHAPDQRRRPVEAGALGREAADGAVEPGHAGARGDLRTCPPPARRDAVPFLPSRLREGLGEGLSA